MGQFIKKTVSNFFKNKELLKRIGTFEKMGKFIQKTVSLFHLGQKVFLSVCAKTVGVESRASGASYHGRAQRAATGERRGERSELPRASAASCQDERSEVSKVPNEAAERFPRAH